jgi:hypothetical protein
MTRVNTVKADYLVATVPLASLNQDVLNELASLTIDGTFRRCYGYAGFVKDNLFVGDNGSRLLLQATGSRANEAISLIETSWPGLSVARIDIQLTVLVGDADALIAGTMPPKPYKAIRISNLGERGSTLYVGSPSSRCRLRIYNKTAESGEERIAGMERLRVELQLRDDYADRGLINMKANTGDMFFRHYVSRMTDGYITAIIDKAFRHSDLVGMVDTVTEKSVDSRKQWLEHSVLPAIQRLSVYDKEFVKEFIARLNELID